MENGVEAKCGAICNEKINTKNDKNLYDNEFIDYGSFNTKAPFPDLTNAMLLLHSIYNLQPNSYTYTYTSDQQELEL